MVRPAPTDDARDREAANRLEAAMLLVEHFMPDGVDRTDVLHRLGVAVAQLRGECSHRLCRPCGVAFVCDTGQQRWLEERGFVVPRHCAECRAAKRAERRRAGNPAFPTP